MLNLLPQEEKKKFIQAYRIRLGVIIATFTSALFIAAAVGLLPSYLSEKEQTNALVKQKQEAEAKNTTESLAEADAKIAKNKAVAEYLQARIPVLESSIPPSLSIEKIFGHKTSLINIESVLFEEKNITLSGVAATRNDLIAFNAALKADTHFKNSSLPISHIAKSVDAPFIIKLELP